MRRWSLLLVCASAACGSFGSVATDAGTSEDGDGGGGGRGGGDGGVGGANRRDGGVTADGSFESDGAAMPPDHIRTIFATAGFFDGALGGIAGADVTCATEAAKSAHAAVIGRSFRAWLSVPNQNVGARLTHGTLPYVKPINNGTTAVVAEGWDFLRVQLERPIDRDQHGEAVNGIYYAWTGTSSEGNSIEPSCSQWNDNASTLSGTVGATFQIDSSWTAHGPKLCSETARLICVEE